MQKIILPPDRSYGTVFAIVKTLSGTYVCPGWHPVPPETTREQIEFDLSATPKKEQPRSNEPEMAIYEVQVAGSKPGKMYTVRQEGGRWSCTCPASTFQRGPCKHIQAEQKKLQNN